LKFLVTCGSPQVPIDKVRTIGNIFKGRTGLNIASIISSDFIDKETLTQKQEVDLITSNVEHVKYGNGNDPLYHPNLGVTVYKHFHDLKNTMQLHVRAGVDVIIHSAAVNDYKVEGVYHRIHNGTLIRLPNSDKFKSNHKELFFRFVPTEKLIDLIRPVWGFKGILVKFKLEVGKSTEELIEIAIKSKEHSQADIIVANCLEWMNKRAIIITPTEIIRVERKKLATELYGEILRLTK